VKSANPALKTNSPQTGGVLLTGAFPGGICPPLFGKSKD
jgi:hypothetical protein